MYIRTIKRKNKDGSVVEYVQLAHNVRHPEKGYPKAEVIHSFGRRDQLDLDALKRLVVSVSRFFDPTTNADAPADAIAFVRSRSAGGAYLLRGLWDRLAMDECLNAAVGPPSVPAGVALALFTLVARHALAPCACLTIAQWIADDVYLGERVEFEASHLERAEALLRDHADAIFTAVHRSAVRLMGPAIDRMDNEMAGVPGTDDPGRLSWLLTHAAAMATGMTWPVIRDEMQRLQLGEFVAGGQPVLRYSQLRPLQRKILMQLAIDPPPPDPPADLSV